MEIPVDKDITHLGAAINHKHQKDVVFLLHNRDGKKSLDFCHDEVGKLNVSLQWFLVLPYPIFDVKLTSASGHEKTVVIRSSHTSMGRIRSPNQVSH